MTAPTLGVVVLASRGGTALEATLAATAWADARAVLIADGARLPVVPAGVDTLAPPEVERLGTSWTLVLREEERLADGGPGTVRAAISAGTPDQVFALPVVTSCLGFRIRRRPQVRLAPGGSRLTLGGGLVVELAAAGRAVRTLEAIVERGGAATLDEAVERLGADAAILASLLDGETRKMHGIVWQPIVAAAVTFRARAAAGRLGLGRWVLAVLDAYAVVFAYARLWERRHDRAVSFT